VFAFLGIAYGSSFVLAIEKARKSTALLSKIGVFIWCFYLYSCLTFGIYPIYLLLKE